MTFNAAITLKKYDSHLENAYRAEIIREWLFRHNIKYDEMKVKHEFFPHTYLMDSQDAVAFRLRFNL